MPDDRTGLSSAGTAWVKDIEEKVLALIEHLVDDDEAFRSALLKVQAQQAAAGAAPLEVVSQVDVDALMAQVKNLTERLNAGGGLPPPSPAPASPAPVEAVPPAPVAEPAPASGGPFPGQPSMVPFGGPTA